MRSILVMIFSAVLLFPICSPAEQTPFLDQKSKDSYSLGYEFGFNIKRLGVELNREILLAAVRDALDGKQPVLEPEEMQKNINQLQKRVTILQDRRARELAEKNLQEGKSFLAANRKKAGITTLPSGLQYKVLKRGNGASPKSTDMVQVHYRGTLIDGTPFDNSRHGGGSADIRVNGVIRGWSEALQLMKPGSRWEIFVPPELAYGKRRFGRIPPNSTLIFELELLSIGNPPREPIENLNPD